MIKKIFFILAVCLLPCVAQTASFDCNNASTNVEKMICSNEELSSADEKLAEAYNAALSVAASKEIVKANQREWIKTRNEITDGSELLSSYQERIQALQVGQVPNEQESSPNKSVDVNKVDKTSETSSALQNPSKNQTTSAKENSSASGEYAIMVGIVFLVIIIAMYSIGIKLQQNGSLNIFVDYTDALLTVSSILVPFIFFMFLNKTSTIIFILFVSCISLALIFFPIKSAFIYNRTIGMAFLALTIKFFTSFMYLLGIILIISSGGGSKKQGESEYAYQARLRRERASASFWMAIHHLILVWIVHKTSRIREFSSETLHLSFSKRFDQLMIEANGND
ncbi:MAG: lysozyme inhibitor LprI family protein [Desulfuromonadaceae bacterium]